MNRNLELAQLVRAKRRSLLDNCPIGLFLFGETLCLMTEYATLGSSGRQRDAYIVESGEYFWGGTTDAHERAQFMVTPCKVVKP